jgi:hypothetical protein
MPVMTGKSKPRERLSGMFEPGLRKLRPAKPKWHERRLASSESAAPIPRGAGEGHAQKDVNFNLNLVPRACFTIRV